MEPATDGPRSTVISQNGPIIELDQCCTWSNFEQGSPAWLQSRCGLLTASRIGGAMGTSEKRRNLMMEILAERFTGKPTDVYTTKAMQWGTDNEPAARQTYTEVTGRPVRQVGLAVSTVIEHFGASSDGLVDVDGMVEIKCPTSQVFMKWVLDGVVPEQHKPQMLAQMAVTGRRWCDFVAFDPRFPPEQDIFIRRFEPHPAVIEEMKEVARKFLAEVSAMEMQFCKAKMI